MKRSLRTLTIALASLCIVAWASVSLARVEVLTPYTKQQVYSAALRYLRVDLGYRVTERDAEAAYLLFEYKVPQSDRTTRGSIEIVPNADARRLLVKLPQMPEYHERALTEGLLKKLRSEYGKAPKPKPKPDPEPEPEPEPEQPDEAG